MVVDGKGYISFPGVTPGDSVRSGTPEGQQGKAVGRYDRATKHVPYQRANLLHAKRSNLLHAPNTSYAEGPPRALFKNQMLVLSTSVYLICCVLLVKLLNNINTGPVAYEHRKQY